MISDVAAAWASQDSERITQALAELIAHPFPRPIIPPPEPAIFDAFYGEIPTSVVMDYIALLGSYHPMYPELEPKDIVRRWVEAVLRSGNSSAALQVVLALREDEQSPVADLFDALGYVLSRSVHSHREKAGAEHLARHFLDHSQTYERAVRALSQWKDDESLQAILHAVAPYVRINDRNALGL